MTTKEEVLRLCARVNNLDGIEMLIALIELAKAQGAAEEREACAKLLEQPITHLNPTECCADKVVQTLRWNFQNLAKAIRARNKS